MDNGELEHLYMRIDPNPSNGLGLCGKIFRVFGIGGLRKCRIIGVSEKVDTIMKMLLLASVMLMLIVILLGLIIPQVVYL